MIDPNPLALENPRLVASVAQLVEQRTLNPFVVGSIPSRGTIISSAFPGSIMHLNAQALLRAEIKAEVSPKKGAQVAILMHVSEDGISP